MATVLDCDRGTPTKDSAVAKDRRFSCENDIQVVLIASRLVSSRPSTLVALCSNLTDI